jgi:hypothetical protein
MKWIMNNFILDVEPDEKLFNLEVPEGYTSSQQWDLDELQPGAEPSAEAKKIVEMLELWPRGQKLTGHNHSNLAMNRISSA